MIRILIASPFLLLLVLFALSNRQPVEFHLWPTDYSLANVPLSVAMLIGMGVAFFAGGLLAWMSVFRARLRARRAEHLAKLLEAQVAELKARLDRPAAVPGPPARTLVSAGR